MTSRQEALKKLLNVISKNSAVRRGSSNILSGNIINESDYSSVDGIQNNVIYMDPSATFYRGYDRSFVQVDTLKKYPSNRPLFFGSAEHALAYSEIDPSEDGIYSQGGIGNDPLGPMYRFWPKRKLKLLSLNEEVCVALIDYLISQDDPVNAARLAYAYGHLYDLAFGDELTRKVNMAIEQMQQKQETKTDAGEDLEWWEKKNLDDFKIVYTLLGQKVQDVAAECIGDCFEDRATTGADSALIFELYATCKKICYESESTSLGRSSDYAVDKPLMRRLSKLFANIPSLKGIDGLFAQTDKLHTDFPNDIIIFNPQRTITSDNVDVNLECVGKTALENCKRLKSPKVIKPIVLRRTA